MLDLNTVFYTSISVTVLMSFLNFLTWRANKSIPGTLLYVFYPVVIFVALSCFFILKSLPSGVSLGSGICTSMLFIASLLQAYALCKFLDFKHISFNIFIAVTTWLIIAFWWFLYGDVNLHNRILIVDLHRIIEALFLSYLFIKIGLNTYPNGSYIYLCNSALLLAVFSLRAFLLFDVNSNEITQNLFFSLPIFMAGILSPMLIATGIAVLCNERRALHLKNMTEKAQKDSELRGLFLSTMSHEIRTPLNGILGSAQLVMNQSNDPRDKPYCEAIINSAESLNLLIDKVLDYASLDQSTGPLYEEDIELKPWLENLCLLLSPLAEQKNIKFELNFNLPDQACYYCDQQKIRQVLINLVGNAIKFTDRGKIKIQVDLIGSTALEHSLRFAVEDTGPGIENDEIEYLTEPYVQSSAGKIKGGTGLGLAISSRILDKLKSQLNISSELGKGSIFSFDITLGLGELSLVEQRHQSSEYLTGLNILLVEDLPLNQKIAIEFMAMDEHKVKLADNGQSAIDMMQKHQFDLVLLDMNLPDFNGPEVLKKLKLLKHKNQRTPILAFTASLSPDEIKEYLSLGIKDIVGKPIKLEKLRQALLNSQNTQAPSLVTELTPVLYDETAAKTLENSFTEDELSSIYNEFVLSARSKLNRCQELLNTDTEQSIKIIHRQASTALQLGFNLYGMALKKVERKLLDKKPTETEFEHISELWQESLVGYLAYVKGSL
ncbi:response regulator [Pseudoalteromonas denitrificans]|uniref:histidine kinase n=1 Tax=Pseudoalteromonas denitrificans DSM 6059 TaxID=1123010 RepID=A0A1I1M9I5_9GAMM|nr:response regulator [Pseudoalteromonas denitrificans]SFC82009.1 hypothetical protein SAMN02745724_02621 [Pseudoalteromonas denitrificans DSM 6059]